MPGRNGLLSGRRPGNSLPAPALRWPRHFSQGLAKTLETSDFWQGLIAERWPPLLTPIPSSSSPGTRSAPYGCPRRKGVPWRTLTRQRTTTGSREKFWPQRCNDARTENDEFPAWVDSSFIRIFQASEPTPLFREPSGTAAACAATADPSTSRFGPGTQPSV